VVVCLSAAFSLFPKHARAQAPGGFLETTISTEVRPLLSSTQINAFLPQRGTFTFPAPYNTRGIRLTNAGDCGGSADCVAYAGYSYWRNINNHVGSDTLLAFVGLRASKGGTGPTLFGYDKVTGETANLGPLFASNSGFYFASGEGWYFSATRPTTLYMNDSSRMLRYDVIARTFETVFDAASLAAGVKIWQMHSSNDDRVHSATLKDSAYADLGCVVYREDTRQLQFYAKRGDFDECQIDASGHWLLIKQNEDALYGEDNRIVNLDTGAEQLLLDQNGAAGHSDVGFGNMVQADNWAALPGTTLLRGFSSLASTTLVYHTTSWATELGHVSYTNARGDVPVAQQYACASSASATVTARSNEIVCFRLDGSLQVLVVAPVMTDMNAAGGGDAYAKLPKANLDVTGQYALWTSNMGGARLDAFIAWVPSQLLVGGSTPPPPPPPPAPVAPSVTMSAPIDGSTVSGAVTVSSDASDDGAVQGVQFILDGAPLGAEDSAAPYSVAWDTLGTPNGTHALTAVARDDAGLSTTSSMVSVTVSNDAAAPVLSSVAAGSVTTSSANVTWTTDEAADGRVDWGTSLSYGSSTAVNAALATSHAQGLTGLPAATLIHYRVRSADASGNIAWSGDFTFTTASPPPPPPSATDPFAWWRFDEGTGTVAKDSAGVYNGALVNGPTWLTTPRRALHLDGKDDYVNVAHASKLDSYPLTVSLWVKSTATNLAAVVNKYGPSSYNGYQVFFNKGNLCAWYFRSSSSYVWDGSSCSLATPGVNDGAWHHVAFVVDSTGGRLFVDGALRTKRGWTGTAGATTTTRSLSIGKYPGVGGSNLPGDVDEVRLYDRALSATEISDQFKAESSGALPPPPPPSGPVTENVVWTSLVNAVASGGTLTKSGGSDGSPDAGAVSSQTITAGDGRLEFTASETSTLRFAGLGSGSASTDPAGIAFAIRLQSGYAEVRESGTYRTDTAFVAGDRFTVAVVSGQVVYSKNGVEFYRSALAAFYPLAADATLYDAGAAVSAAVIVRVP
jgi:hypothetical protein